MRETSSGLACLTDRQLLEAYLSGRRSGRLSPDVVIELTRRVARDKGWWVGREIYLVPEDRLEVRTAR